MRKLIVRSEEQVAELWEDGRVTRTYMISTARNGLGCVEGSYCTPTGKLGVAKKIGAGEPLGRVFKARVPTEQVWADQPGHPLVASADDLVLSRILWLEGREGHNANTLQRYVYLHGTNQEHLLGMPVSHGCIRFRNRDVIELFELLDEGSEVLVV